MLEATLLSLSLLCYCLASWLIWQSLQGQTKESKTAAAFVIAAVAIAVHLIYAIIISGFGISLNFSLTSMAVLISAILTSIYFVSSFFTPIHRLGALVFPVAAACVLCAVVWNSPPNFLGNRSAFFNGHIIISIVAYSILALASLQSLLYVYQERQIKKRNNPSLLLALPPLQTMESLLFQMLGLGFILLSLTLLSGALFSQELFGQAFEFKHHTILAVVGWLVFAWLLVQRVKYGMRGSQAVIWTWCGFILIQLGYFGTKIVNESLNIQ